MALKQADGNQCREREEAQGCAAIVGTSERIRQVFVLIRKVADADTTVLVRGESGTGKELVAQALHQEGGRGRGPFIAVNCGAIPAELLESELFGHERGAFTHAVRSRPGRFELAHGGTVFLDEIAEMSPMLQVKLLRVLQEKKFERVGGTRTISSDFRVVAATNRDLEHEVKEGRFREDLYYRLNVIPVDAPPLRERISDIPLLVEHFIARFNVNRRKKIRGIKPEALDCLQRYPWPGNVRELENTVERMVILAAGRELGREDIPERLLAGMGAAPAGQESPGPAAQADLPTVAAGPIPPAGFVLSEVVAEFEKRLIVQAMEQTGWVKNRAAKLLNVNRTTLLEKMKRYRLNGPEDV
ncbi:sigma-54 interaction domain-containing protein [Desulfurivibrio alkaliphilus]|uniref:Sigma54 specific transcriptional regulator, Fis family n=1 Tax=Desulfurivibrio alkaliphilus (strain DSM 19089 / UNIQEM U267 / AHT2) TaxID=589865 RepID=D6Z2W7_DESAT|nr:sigma-54 dependent transcriptional regulator [Desulfurivibrio alkaliphilus]ADH85892.1 sigma54 specific transcriptional regulator, Fis family [Desulfurivibrio alkaliphilus AHT 2]